MLETKIDLGHLNEKQLEAVVSEDKRILVLAGAGSGKTKTLLQKLIYLIQEKGISSSSILAISFTKNATNEMIDRLIISADSSDKYEALLSERNLTKAEKDIQRGHFKKKYNWIDNLTIKTFHGFCYGILRDYGVNEFDNKFKIIGEEKRDEENELYRNIASETIFEVVQKIIIEKCEDPHYLLQLKRYILDYYVDKVHKENYNQNNFYKDGKCFTTLDGTKVRSKSEQFIADWLYRHKIKYEYEPTLRVKDFTFHPDFYINDANLYLEHISNLSYSTEEKEQQFALANIKYYKTYDSMTKDSVSFNHTLDSIIKDHLPMKLGEIIALSYREEFNGYHEHVKDFINQVIRIIEMIKVENNDLDVVLENSKKDQHIRVRNFYELVIPIIRKYTEYCINKSYLDFNDLISRCASLFQNNKDIVSKFRSKYKYVLVDEFQDVNNLQVELLKLLLTENTQLFCVGDDWQSIYGFRGSNVDYIVNFEKYFPQSTIVKLNLNYRSSSNIVAASNEVIKNNKIKVEKEIFATKISEHKIVVFSGNTEIENINFCTNKIIELLENGFTNDDILFLYRRSKMYSPYFSHFKNQHIRVNAKTIHAAKGLESKVVFIIGLKEGSGGFPEIWL